MTDEWLVLGELLNEGRLIGLLAEGILVNILKRRSEVGQLGFVAIDRKHNTTQTTEVDVSEDLEAENDNKDNVDTKTQLASMFIESLCF